MEYSRVEIRPGVWLTHLREEKFKTACFSVNLLSQLSRQTVSMNALVPYVLHRGTKLWPDMQALSEREEELFGTVVEPIVRRIGEIHCSGFYAGFPEDEYLPGDESVLSDAIGLSLSLLLDPVTRGGLLLPDYVESEQEKLLDMIAARVNNKRSYAVLRCMEEMCAFEDYAAGRLGDEAGARAINYKKLSRHYRMLLQTCPIELFYCGHADVKKVRAILQDQLATLPRGEIDFDIGTEIRMNAVEDQPRLTVEEMDVAQVNLVIGWRLGECMEEPDYPALYVFNELFGGSPSSRLFLNVREKHSLCYYVSSLLDIRKGLLLVSSGVQAQNIEKAKDEIFSQLEAMKRGEFSEEDLETARAGVASDLRSIPDSQSALEGFFVSQALAGADYGPMELAELVCEVTADRVAAIAASTVCDQIYLLRAPEASAEGTGEEEEGGGEA
ncbi:MAG: insulinase family protein [Oscillospiraceae bacterium]|nr:insulinase family protein [Oscillospiraceae bacterium]MBQ6428839.1 insulinase family protein [Oscillospiraceae bacterium]